MLWRAGQLGSLGTRRGSTLPPTELPPLNIIPPGALGHSAPQSLPLSAFPEMANPQRFLGSSLLAWHGLSLPISQPWHLSLMFRTRQADGVLLQAVTRGRSTITLQVTEGGMGQAGPGTGYWSELAGRGLSRERKGSSVPLVDHCCHLSGPQEIMPFPPWPQLGSRMGLGAREGQWAGR